MPEDNQVELGKEYTRDQVAAVFGGQTYSGIAPSNTTPNVVLYSDPKAGHKYDYHDDLEAEDDFGRPLVLYTGEGKPELGDQQMTKGNKAILNHKEDGRALQLFAATGKVVPGTATKLHEYLGEYELDELMPYYMHEARGQDGQHKRLVIMFRLRPVGTVAAPPIDYVSVADRTEALELQLGPSKVKPLPQESASKLMEPERQSTTEKLRKASPAAVTLSEFLLVQRFISFLESKERTAQRLGLTIEGIPGMFPTDLFEVESKVLYEAKGRADRNSIRLAIGQLFDYRRHIQPQPNALAILLPEAPDHDLRDLIETVGISLVYEEDGKFVGWPVVNDA